MTRLDFAPVIPLSALTVLIALALLVTLYGFATRARGAWARGLAFAVPAGDSSGAAAFPTGFFFFGFEAILLVTLPGPAREQGPQNIGTLDSSSQGDRTHRRIIGRRGCPP